MYIANQLPSLSTCHIIDVALRVNLSASETFLHLMIAMEQQLKMVLERGHFPFKTVIEEVCPQHEKSKIPFSYMLYAYSVKEPIEEL